METPYSNERIPNIRNLESDTITSNTITSNTINVQEVKASDTNGLKLVNDSGTNGLRIQDNNIINVEGNSSFYSSKASGEVHFDFKNSANPSHVFRISNSTIPAFNIPCLQWSTQSQNPLDCYIARAGNSDLYIANGPTAAEDINLACVGHTNTNAGWLTSSDDRIKHNEQPLTNALENIRQLRGFRYYKTTKMYPPNYDFPLDSSGNPITTDASGNDVPYKIEDGFIAQSVLEIPEFAHMVYTNPLNKRDPITNELQPYRLKYDGLFVNSIVALQELDKEYHDKIAELEARISALEN